MLALGPLRDARELDVVEMRAGQPAQGAQRRDLERRARRQADVHRHPGFDVDVERIGHAAEAIGEFAQAAVDVAPEALARRFGEREPDGLVELPRVHPMPAARRPADRHFGALRNRDRQHEAVVVVGVLAEQVDAAGRVRHRVGRAAEGSFESGAHGLLSFRPIRYGVLVFSSRRFHSK